VLTVHRSAATEPLVDRLADGLRSAPPDDPFTPVEVAVQSRGMERWLSHQLAQRLGAPGAGVSANIAFPFPGKVVTTAAAAALGQRLEEDPWSPERLVWPLLEVLPSLLTRQEALRIAHYLGVGDARLGSVDRRTWALAREIADLLDRYALYRPGMVRAWSAGRDVGPDGAPIDPAHRWQPLLWRALRERIAGEDPSTRLDRAISHLRTREPLAEPGLLPERVTVFGLSALPPRHLELLHALAVRLPVDLYVLTPSPRRWERLGDAVVPPPGDDGERRLGEGRGDVRRQGDGGTADALHPLLDSCARLVDDLRTALGGLDHEDRPCTPAPPGESRLLDVLQQDLRDDRDRGAPGADAPAHPLAPSDTSVQLHACHGPSRQVEVLRETLLGLLADDPSLEPRDVLVMTPDVEEYAPLVATVFAEVDRDAPSLPVRVADRSLRGTNPVAEVLLDLCALADGRVTASAVLDLVGAGPVAANFSLTTEELARVTGWVAESGIRWGVDERDRAASGQPRERVHTWRFGLDRLLAGAAVADEDDRRVGDVTPFDDVEGQDVQLLGRFVDAVAELFGILERLSEPRPLGEWAAVLREALDRLVELDDADRWRVHEMRRTLDDLAELPACTDATPTLELGAVRSLLEQSVDAGRGAAGYETGAVTVCAMVPMRSIPHRVVCLLGADDEAFPRVGRRHGFDLLGHHREVGDRDRRDEDRFLFLEALLAARDHLVITYTGRDPRTNERRAPAVPVAELLDVLERSATPSGHDGRDAHEGQEAEDAEDARRRLRERLVTEHPLQPYSPRNFGVDEHGAPCPPRSFDPAQLQAARSLQAVDDAALRPFLEGSLPPPEEDDLAVVRVDELARFLRHPARGLLESRLGLRLREDVTIVRDTEPLDLDFLEQYGVGAELLDACLQDRDRDRWREALLARGTVPAGAFGHHEVEVAATRVDALLAEVADDDVLHGAEERVLDLAVDGVRVQGVIGGLHGSTRLVLQYAKVGARHELDLWIQHLALAADGRTDVTSRLVGRGGGDKAKVVQLAPLHEDPDLADELARQHLGRLLRLRAEGLTRVLPLFETTSAAYAVKADGDGPEAHAAGIKAASAAWERSPLPDGRVIPGDRDDPYVVQAWGEDVDLDDLDRDTDFARLALTVYRPLLEHRASS
jgi:exodeoxyribonuclease V gamma subunit